MLQSFSFGIISQLFTHLQSNSFPSHLQSPTHFPSHLLHTALNYYPIPCLPHSLSFISTKYIDLFHYSSVYTTTSLRVLQISTQSQSIQSWDVISGFTLTLKKNLTQGFFFFHLLNLSIPTKRAFKKSLIMS